MGSLRRWAVARGRLPIVQGGRWSGRRDLNSRLSAPKADALPGCATPRLRSSIAHRGFEEKGEGGRERQRHLGFGNRDLGFEDRGHWRGGLRSGRPRRAAPTERGCLRSGPWRARAVTWEAFEGGRSRSGERSYNGRWRGRPPLRPYSLLIWASIRPFGPRGAPRGFADFVLHALEIPQDADFLKVRQGAQALSAEALGLERRSGPALGASRLHGSPISFFIPCQRVQRPWAFRRPSMSFS